MSTFPHQVSSPPGPAPSNARRTPAPHSGPAGTEALARSGAGSLTRRLSPFSLARLARLINPATLLLAIVLVSVAPVEKEIWYDEAVSIQISKGISHASPGDFAGTDTIHSSTLRKLNTPGDVFRATVKDNGNSFPYNLGLHWFTAAFGNTVGAYTWFSRLGAIATLVAVYAFARLLFGTTIWTSLAVLLLLSDVNFAAMSHEIRAYSLAMFFVALAGLYAFRFTAGPGQTRHLLLAAVCSASAFLSHYLTVYAILVLAVYAAFRKPRSLLLPRNAAAILAPAGVVSLYMLAAADGLAALGWQSAAWRHRLAGAFTLSEVAVRSGRLGALDFKVVLPAFTTNGAVLAVSVLLVLGLYAMSVRLAEASGDRRNLRLLFALGASATVFLAATSVLSQHYAALYSRYHAFAAPFSCLFVAYALRVILRSRRLSRPIRAGVLGLIVIPCGMLAAARLRADRPVQKYNHPAVARQIVAEGVERVGVPDWRHAFLVNSFLPNGYQIAYVRDRQDSSFTLHAGRAVWSVPIVAIDY